MRASHAIRSCLFLCLFAGAAGAQDREELLDRIEDRAVFRTLAFRDAILGALRRSIDKKAGPDGVLDMADVERREAEGIAADVRRKLSIARDLDLDGDGAILSDDVAGLRAMEDRRYANQLDLWLSAGVDENGDGALTADEIARWAEESARAAAARPSALDLAGRQTLATWDRNGDGRTSADEAEAMLRALWSGYSGTPEAPACPLPPLDAERIELHAPAAGADGAVRVEMDPYRSDGVVAVVTPGGPVDVHLVAPEGADLAVIVPRSVGWVTGVAPGRVLRVKDSECLTPPDPDGGERAVDVRRAQIAFATGVHEVLAK